MLKVQEVRELIKLIDESSIDEFTYEANGTKVEMKKSLDSNTRVSQPVTTQKEDGDLPKIEAVRTNEEVVAVQVTEQTPVAEEPKNDTNYDYEIKSPMVGTFYSAPNPESDPYVKTGDSVQKESIVCIVEAMKLFNEIEAEVSGEIIEVLAENGELVEYGQPLFRVKTK